MIQTAPARKATALNGNRSGIADWQSEPSLAAALREIELTVAADVISDMTGGPWTSNDPLAERCASRIAHMGVFSDVRLPTARVTDGRERQTESMDALAVALAAHPRGTWQVWQGEAGYSAWCSDGFGGVRCWAGETLSHKTERGPRHDAVCAHAMTLQTLVYEYRDLARRAIVEHSMAVGCPPTGTKLRNVPVDGKTWTNMTYLGVVDGAHRFAVSRRGQRATLTTQHQGAKRILGVPTVVPDSLVGPDGADRTTSPRELRSAAAQAEFDRLAPELGMTARWGSKAQFTRIDEHRLERTVYGDDDVAIGRFEVVFDGTAVHSSAFLRGGPISNRF